MALLRRDDRGRGGCSQALQPRSESCLADHHGDSGHRPRTRPPAAATRPGQHLAGIVRSSRAISVSEWRHIRSATVAAAARGSLPGDGRDECIAALFADRLGDHSDAVRNGGVRAEQDRISGCVRPRCLDRGGQRDRHVRRRRLSRWNLDGSRNPAGVAGNIRVRLEHRACLPYRKYSGDTRALHPSLDDCIEREAERCCLSNGPNAGAACRAGNNAATGAAHSRPDADRGAAARRGRDRRRFDLYRAEGRIRSLVNHDPEKWVPVFPRDKREAFARRSCSNKKIERDDDSKKSHPALDIRGAASTAPRTADTLHGWRRSRGVPTAERFTARNPMAGPKEAPWLPAWSREADRGSTSQGGRGPNGHDKPATSP